MQVLIIGYVWPEPNSSAAGRRMMDLIEVFQRRGAAVTFASAAQRGEHSVDLEAQGVASKDIALNCSSFDRFVSDLNPSVVVFDRFFTEEQFAWRVERSCESALRILDTEDLHCLRHARHQALKQGREVQRSDLFSDIAQREIAAIWRCDISLIISEYEINLLQECYGVAPDVLHYLPLLSTLRDEDSQQWSSFAEREHCVVIGNFRHAPNWDAVQYLRAYIWPKIRKTLPNVECHVYGAYPPPKALQLHNEKLGFLIKGWAKSAVDVVSSARLCLAPLRFGAGQKGKLLEAMECGTPSVTSDIGAEAMSGNMPWSGAVINGAPLFSTQFAEEFASAALRLYQNENDWQLAQAKGKNLISSRYVRDVYLPRFMSRVDTLLEDLSAHRQSHFNSIMLRQQTLKSHQYMSQWIEAKARLSALDGDVS
ncbi:glycosyltransferase family 4 protein [Zhongshania marina]|uniref:Glycosyltransferase n=1 Tax=Zhongshania marina TaxID=2304603 RepID=A0A2S4HEF6_9GAMM|nr:glycosyltransferase family 4 protein [Marortus luteolus]POP52350.1 glycosyltransferase [Marortus luteolus]